MNIDISMLKSLPKGELHVHLNGLVAADIIRQILHQEDVIIPEGFNLDTDLNILAPKASLQDYLKPWEVLRMIPSTRKNLKVLVNNAFYNLKKDNVEFVEIRNTLLYLALNLGVPVSQAMRWLLDDIEEATIKYNIQSGLILTIGRGENSVEDLRLLLKAYEQLGKPANIVGLDLAGNEEIPIFKDLGGQFKAAKQKYGLGITIHAGETGKPANIIQAINEFHADRIGHGTAANTCQETMELIKEKDICLEICPLSNRLTNSVANGTPHPVIDFIAQGVPFVICSDNPQIHNKSLTGDYAEFLKETSRLDIINQMLTIQTKYKFI